MRVRVHPETGGAEAEGEEELGSDDQDLQVQHLHQAALLMHHGAVTLSKMTLPQMTMQLTAVPQMTLRQMTLLQLTQRRITVTNHRA